MIFTVFSGPEFDLDVLEQNYAVGVNCAAVIGKRTRRGFQGW